MKGRFKMDWISWATIILTASITGLTLYNSSRDKDDQIARQKEIITELQNLITGGDGIIYIRPAISTENGKAIMAFEFKGKYPLYDVTITSEESDLVPLDAAKDLYSFKKTGTRNFQLGTVNPLQNLNAFEIFDLPTDKESQYGKWYFLKISTRNVLIEEDIFLRKEGSHYSMAYKVITFSPNYDLNTAGSIKNSRAVLRHIDQGFPVHQLPENNLRGTSGWCTTFETTTGANLSCEGLPNAGLNEK